MIFDKLTEFADAVSVANAAGDDLIGNVIDLGANPLPGPHGRPIYLVIQTETEIITGGSAGTISFALVSDSTADLATSPTTHFSTGTFVTDDSAANSAQLNAGGVIAVVALPLSGAVYERYLGIIATVATTTVTAGTINAFLTLTPPVWQALPDASN